MPDHTLEKNLLKKYEKLTKAFSTPTITAEELIKAMDADNIILVDVREKEEQAVSMIANAISAEEFNKNSIKYKNKKIIAYCTIGYRSAIFADKHKNLHVINLIGGVLMWSHVNGSFKDHKGKTNKVHVYAEEWNYLNSQYQAVTE